MGNCEWKTSVPRLHDFHKHSYMHVSGALYLHTERRVGAMLAGERSSAEECERGLAKGREREPGFVRPDGYRCRSIWGVLPWAGRQPR